MRVRIFAVAVLSLLTGFAADSQQAPVSHSAAGAAEQPALAYVSDPKFTQAMNEAKHLAQTHQYGFAADAYKKANKLAGGKCFDCLLGQYNAQFGAADFKGAAATAAAMQELAQTPAAKSMAEYRRGAAMFQAAGEKPKPDKLEAVHGVLQEAIGEYPKNAPALFLDGKVMTYLGKMEEASADFKQCVSCVSSSDPARLRAEHFAENPELSIHKMAPPFEVTALDGSKFNLDAMGGRVVLIDFWATWCPSCVAEIPHMKQIAKQFAGQPLVIISVSWDSDEQKWKDYVGKNEMTWVQYRDSDHKLAEAFGINAIPHYFTIDSDGVLTSEMVGGGSDVEGKLRKLLAKAREGQKQTVASTGPSTGN